MAGKGIARKSRAILQLIRPELPLAAGICVVVGQTIALGRFPPISLLGLGFALGFFLSSTAMIYNDYFDLEVDRINSPQRPLPSGLLTRFEAITAGGVTALIAFVIAWVIHPIAFMLSLFTWLIGFFYNWKLKAAGLWGNLIVSTSVAMTFIMGGVSVGRAANPMLWIFSLIAFVFDLAEEIAGDAMDMTGDRKRSSKSIAIRYGKMVALRISCLLFGVMVILTFFPIVWGETGLGYLVPIALMDVLILFFVSKLLKSSTPQEGRRSMRGLYITATLGLVAFILATFIG